MSGQQQWRVPIDEALGWELYKKSLRQQIVDDCERALDLYEAEGTIYVMVDGQDFLATFVPAGEELEPARPPAKIDVPALLAKIHNLVKQVCEAEGLAWPPGEDKHDEGKTNSSGDSL